MPKVLIVDDDISLLKVSSIAMRREGYEVEVATDAESGLKHISRSGFDLVLVDQSIPGMNGTEFIDELNQRNIRSMLALMTGFESGDVVRRDLPCLPKPFNYSQLVRFVNTLLRRSA